MRVFLLLLTLGSFLFASDEELLNSTKKEINALKEKQVLEKEEVNKYQWLSDITLGASVSKDESGVKSEDYSLSLSQDIFRFGGINSQMQYAKELALMENLSIKMENKDDLAALFSALVSIKLSDVQMEQNSLSLQNAQIDINHKTSQYKNGEIGISDLNDAIMTKNSLKESAKEIELAKKTSQETLKLYTDKTYETIAIPELKLIERDFFISQALAIKYASSSVAVQSASYEVKKSDYLPALSFNASAGYNKNDSNSEDYHNYGLKISMPLSYTSSNDIEQSRLEYLISQQELNDAVTQAKITYEKAMLSIKNYQERIVLAKEDIKLYEELLSMNQQEYEAGYKTVDDVTALKNSMKLRELDIKIYELDIKQQFLNLYFQL